MLKRDDLFCHLPEADAALIASKVNRRYFCPAGIDEGLLLLTRKGSYYLTDFRYYEAALKTLSGCEVLCYEKALVTLRELTDKLGLKNIALEAKYITVSQAENFKKELPGCSLDFSGTLDKAIGSLRVCKSNQEIKEIKKTQAIADKAFEHILGFLRQGVTELEVALELEFFMRKNLAQRAAFDIIVASGKNSSMPHAVPTSKPIESGDFVVIDLGAVVEGYHSDMTRTVVIGNVSGRQLEVYNTVLKAQQSALKAVRAGAECKSVDLAARNIIDNAGFSGCFGHGTGHGVGLEIHESPSLSQNSDEVLKKNMVVTVEPGIYLSGEFGVRIEDLVRVTETGCEVMSKADKQLIIL